jgi:hypothetical protein
MVIMNDIKSTIPAIITVSRNIIFNGTIPLPVSGCCFSDEVEGGFDVSLKIPSQTVSTLASSGIHLIKVSPFFTSGHYGGKEYESNKGF